MFEDVNIDIGIARFVHKNPENMARLKHEVGAYLEKHPHDHTHLFIMGHILYIEEDYAAAEKCFAACIALDKGNKKYHDALAFVYRHSGQYQKSDDIIFG